MELDKILSDAKNLRSYGDEQRILPTTADNTINESTYKSSTPFFKFEELVSLFKRQNIFISRKYTQYCKNLLNILQRTLKMDIAFITDHNINNCLFQSGTPNASSRSFNFIPDLQITEQCYQRTIIDNLLSNNIFAIVTIPIRLESGSFGSLVAIHQTAFASSTALTKKQQLVVTDIGKSIEEVLQMKPKEDWHEARMHLSLCFGLMSCLKPLLHELTSMENHINSVWKEITQLIEIKALSMICIKEGNYTLLHTIAAHGFLTATNTTTSLHVTTIEPSSASSTIPEENTTTIAVNVSRNVLGIADINNSNTTEQHQQSLPTENEPKPTNSTEKVHHTRPLTHENNNNNGLIARMRPLLRRSVDSTRSTDGQQVTIRQIAFSYFTGDNNNNNNNNNNNSNTGTNNNNSTPNSSQKMTPLLSALSGKLPVTTAGAASTAGTGAGGANGGGNLSNNSLNSASTGISSANSHSNSNASDMMITHSNSFGAKANQKGIVVPSQLQIPTATTTTNTNTKTNTAGAGGAAPTAAFTPSPKLYLTTATSMKPLIALALKNPSAHDDLIVGHLAQLQLYLINFEDTLLSMIDNVERTITVAKGYLLADRKKYIQSCSEFMTVGLVSKVNAILTKMSQKVVKNSLLWTFKVDSALAHCCHRTFYHHLILFLENIIYYWAQYSTTTQLLIGFEPVERNVLNKHPYYVSTVEGFIKVLMRFPDRIDGTSITPTAGTGSGKTPIYRRAVSPAHKRTAEEMSQEKGEIGNLSFRHASPYTPADNVTSSIASPRDGVEHKNSTNQSNNSSSSSGASTPGPKKYSSMNMITEESIAAPAEESFHPVRHIHQLLSLLNSSLCRLNQSSTAATVNVRSDSCRITSQEAYFIRIPCMLYLTKAQDNAFLQNNGYRYVDTRYHLNQTIANNNHINGMNREQTGIHSYHSRKESTSANTHGLLVPRWVYYPLRFICPLFISSGVRIHSIQPSSSSGSANTSTGKKKPRRRNSKSNEAGGGGTVRPSTGNKRRTNHNTASVTPQEVAGGGDDVDDNASVSSEQSAGSANSRNSATLQTKAMPNVARKALTATITPMG